MKVSKELEKGQRCEMWQIYKTCIKIDNENISFETFLYRINKEVVQNYLAARKAIRDMGSWKKIAIR